MKYLKELSIKNRVIHFPFFLPDATRAVIRSLDSFDLKEAGVEGIVVNVFHLMSNPGITVLKSLGNVKYFMNWDRLVVSDSGGFQLLSVIRENKSYGNVNSDGIIFYPGSQGARKKLTPEKSIQIQFSIGSDIFICLDDCPSINASVEENISSVNRTIEWAKRCKEEFQKQLYIRKMQNNHPLLFAVIHGGNDENLRERCAEELIKIGFDGFCFGGWPLDKDGKFNNKILSFTANLIPDDLPKFALGVGNPKAIVDCFLMGYNMFDCVLPTRDARHQRLYIFPEMPEKSDVLNSEKVTDFVYIMDQKYIKDTRPISIFCDCHTCRNYSRAYIHHLFEINDSLALRLATIHNLRTYTKLIEILRNSKV